MNLNSNIAPEITEMRKQKHREAQARYRAKNANNIRLQRFLCTKKGRQYKLDLLCESETAQQGEYIAGNGGVGKEVGVTIFIST